VHLNCSVALLQLKLTLLTENVISSRKRFVIYILDFFCRFVCKNNGVLFENDLIQIGVKSEFRQNLGRLGLFYGNKTSFALQVHNVKYSKEKVNVS
jgi:hypothetical protein